MSERPAGVKETAQRMFSSLVQRVRDLRLPELLVFLLAWPLLTLVSVLPPLLAVRLGKVLGALAFYIDERHRKVSLLNLKIAFPHLRASERWDLARRNFENVGKTFVELPGLKRRKPEEFPKRVQYKDWHHYENIEDKSRGVLMLTGHLGNWEFMALSHGFRGSPSLAFVARPLDNLYLERWISGLRGRSGNRLINKRGALRQVVRSLRQGYGVGMLMDQGSTGRDSVFVDFFSHPAGSSVALAYIAMRTGSPVMPVYSLRDSTDTTYTICAEPLVPMQNTGRKLHDLYVNTQRCQKVLEGIIRKNPEQWFWMHRRWKGSPSVHYPGSKQRWGK